MPQRSLCHVVTPISPGWKRLTSDPWAVTSWEIQCSEGGQRDKERHAEVRAEPECRYWTAFIVVIFGFGSCESQTDDDTDNDNSCWRSERNIQEGLLFRRQQRLKFSHDAYHRVTYWTLKCTHTHTCTYARASKHNHTHAHTSCTAVERDITNLKMFVLTERNLGPQSHTTAADAQMKNLCCVRESVSGRRPLKHSVKTFRV